MSRKFFVGGNWKCVCEHAIVISHDQNGTRDSITSLTKILASADASQSGIISALSIVTVLRGCCCTLLCAYGTRAQFDSSRLCNRSSKLLAEEWRLHRRSHVCT